MMCRQTGYQMDRCVGRWANRQGGQVGRQTGEQMDRWVDRQVSKRINGQTDVW